MDLKKSSQSGNFLSCRAQFMAILPMQSVQLHYAVRPLKKVHFAS